MTFTVQPRREMTPEDNKRLKEFLNKEGYDSFKTRMENLIASYTTDLINTKNLDNIAKIEAVQTVIKICDNERT